MVLFDKVVQEQVAFGSSKPFYIGDDMPENSFRQSYVTMSEWRIKEGIGILTTGIKKMHA